MIARL